MAWRSVFATKKPAVRGLALRILAILLVAGGLATLFCTSLGSVSLNQQDGEDRLVRKAAVEVQIYPVGHERIPQRRQDLPLIPYFDRLNHAAADPLKPRTKSLYNTKEFRQQLLAASEEPLGKVYRLESSLDRPLGAPPAYNLLCLPLSNSTRTVAIIGNGPLSQSDRSSIQLHDLVIRFNLMNNWHRFKERVDIWIMRYSKEAAAGYWGITNINNAEAQKILSMLKGVWLVGGKQAHADSLLSKHPLMEAHNPVLMPESPMNKAFAEGILSAPNSYPSTGFVGIQAVLHCTPPEVVLHIYGFNWSKKTWGGHNVDAERAYVLGLQAEGRAIVHATACEGMRECGQGDIDASCHWSTSGHYLCLRGKPRKWRDMTSWINAKRYEEFRTIVAE